MKCYYHTSKLLLIYYMAYSDYNDNGDNATVRQSTMWIKRYHSKRGKCYTHKHTNTPHAPSSPPKTLRMQINPLRPRPLMHSPLITQAHNIPLNITYQALRSTHHHRTLPQCLLQRPAYDIARLWAAGEYGYRGVDEGLGYGRGCGSSAGRGLRCGGWAGF
jgi:hypothetical protein